MPRFVRLVPAMTMLLVFGCGESTNDVPGARWVGDPVSSRPADPAPLELPGAKPDAAVPKLTAVEPARRTTTRRALTPPTRDERPAADTTTADPAPDQATPATAAVGSDAAELVAHTEAMLSARKLRQALDSAKRAAAKAPGDPDIASLVGRVYAASGNHYAAADAFGRALRLDAQHVEALYGLARAQIGMKRTRPATATLARLEAIRPDDRRVIELRAALGAAGGDDAKAAAALQKVADKYPTDPDALARLGNSLARQGKYEEAVAALEKAVAKRPRDGELLLQLGTAQGLAGRLGQADSTLARAARQSNSKDAWSNLAATREGRGDLDGAIVAWKRMRSLIPPPERPKLDARVRDLQARIDAEAEAAKKP